MRSTKPAVCVALVATLALAAPSAGASAGADPTSASAAELKPREIQADAAATARPRTVRERGDAIRAPQLAQAAARPTLSSVDQDTYDQWKLDAQTDDSAAAIDPGSDPGTRAPAPRVPAVGPSFVGLDQDDSMSSGYSFSPPDTQIAKGPSFVVQATNSALRMTSTTGTLVAQKTLNGFFGAAHNNANGGLDLLYDPRVYFDRNAENPRYYVAAVQSYGTGGNTGVARIWLAVSRGPDPTTLDGTDWCTYGIDARRDTGTPKASWADFPQLGVGRDSLIISANQFRFTDSSFTYAVVRVFDKTAASRNLVSCPEIPFWTFQPTTTLASQSVFSLQPVQSYSASSSFKGTKNPAYLMSTDVPSGTSVRLHVWRIKNVAKGVPTMALKTLNGTFTYSMPPNAPQPGGGGVLLDTGDTRVQSASSRGDVISTVWDTGCQFLEGNNETCFVYARVNVGQTDSATLKASIAEEFGWGLGENAHVFFPSVAVNSSDMVAVAAQTAGSDFGNPDANFLGTAWLLKARESIGWPLVVSQPGSCGLGAGDNRAGDYTGVQVDPGDNTGFWMAAEYAFDPGGGCIWGTRVARLLP